MPRGVPRIPEPWEWVRTKQCTICTTVKPWALFSPGRKWPDGTVRTVISRCQRCASQTGTVPAMKYVSKDPDRWRTYKRDWKRRRDAQLRAERGGSDVWLAAAPVTAWLQARRREFASVNELSARVGMHPDNLRPLMNGRQERVSMRIADRCVTRLGGRLYDLYPELEESAA